MATSDENEPPKLFWQCKINCNTINKAEVTNNRVRANIGFRT